MLSIATAFIINITNIALYIIWLSNEYEFKKRKNYYDIRTKFFHIDD